jgi:hypothetical protein
VGLVEVSIQNFIGLLIIAKLTSQKKASLKSLFDLNVFNQEMLTAYFVFAAKSQEKVNHMTQELRVIGKSSVVMKHDCKLHFIFFTQCFACIFLEKISHFSQMQAEVLNCRLLDIDFLRFKTAS